MSFPNRRNNFMSGRDPLWQHERKCVAGDRLERKLLGCGWLVSAPGEFVSDIQLQVSLDRAVLPLPGTAFVASIAAHCRLYSLTAYYPHHGYLTAGQMSVLQLFPHRQQRGSRASTTVSCLRYFVQ